MRGKARSANFACIRFSEVCGFTGLRCDEDAATFVDGGFNVRVLCTNTGAEANAGGFGLARYYSVTPDEARRVGLG